MIFDVSPHFRLSRIAALFCIVLVLCSPAGSAAGTLKAQVVDAETGKPIEGAVVLGVWSKVSGLPGLHHAEFVGVKEVQTSVEGWFALEKPKSLGIDEESITVYKPGYVAWNNLFVFPNSKRRQDTSLPFRILLERFPASQSHKRHIDFISGATRGRDNPESTPKFWNALRPEQLMP